MRNIFQRLGNIHIICVRSRCRIHGQRHLNADAVVGVLSLSDGQSKRIGSRIDVIAFLKYSLDYVVARIRRITVQLCSFGIGIIGIFRGIVPFEPCNILECTVCNRQLRRIGDRGIFRKRPSARVSHPTLNVRRGLFDGILHAGGLGIFTLAQRDAAGVGARVGGSRGQSFITLLVDDGDLIHR